MKAAFQEKLVQLQEQATAFVATCRELGKRAAAAERAALELCSDIQDAAEAGFAELPQPGLLRVRGDGGRRYLTEKEGDKICHTSEADLILHVPSMRLRYVRRDGTHKKPAKWTSISWAKHKVLLVGMSRPGRPFGNSTIGRAFPEGYGISQRTLTRYIWDITKLIQGGGTKGPYVRRVSGVYDESETGYAYVFEPRWQYLVIENCPLRNG